jgi:hypothetical protein
MALTNIDYNNNNKSSLVHAEDDAAIKEKSIYVENAEHVAETEVLETRYACE